MIDTAGRASAADTPEVVAATTAPEPTPEIAQASTLHPTLRNMLAGVSLLFGLFLLCAMVDYHPNHLVGVGEGSGNICGPAGAHLAHAIIGTWGVAGFILPLGLAISGFCVLVGRWRGCFWRRLTGLALLLPAASGLIHLASTSLAVDLIYYWDHVHLAGLGGRSGFALTGFNGSDQAGLLISTLGGVGSLLVLLAVVAVSVWLLQLGLAPLSKALVRSAVSTLKRAQVAAPASEHTSNESSKPSHPERSNHHLDATPSSAPAAVIPASEPDNNRPGTKQSQDKSS